jgi:hypothetical protein
LFQFLEDNPGDQEPGYHKKDIDANEPTRHQQAGVTKQNAQNSDGAKTVYVSAVVVSVPSHASRRPYNRVPVVPATIYNAE